MRGFLRVSMVFKVMELVNRNLNLERFFLDRGFLDEFLKGGFFLVGVGVYFVECFFVFWYYYEVII